MPTCKQLHSENFENSQKNKQLTTEQTSNSRLITKVIKT